MQKPKNCLESRQKSLTSRYLEFLENLHFPTSVGCHSIYYNGVHQPALETPFQIPGQMNTDCPVSVQDSGLLKSCSTPLESFYIVQCKKKKNFRLDTVKNETRPDPIMPASSPRPLI